MNGSEMLKGMEMIKAEIRNNQKVVSVDDISEDMKI